MAPAVSSGQRGRLVFALDATMSRQPTWDAACRLQAQMFQEAGSIGGLDVQLVYFRGLNECRTSDWVAQPERLGALMEKIDCRGGHTQIGKVLKHVRKESEKRRVQALVYVGDAMEEPIDDLCAAAGELGLLRRSGLHVPGGRRPGRRECLSRDRAAQPRRLCAVSRRGRRRNWPSCCAPLRPMPPAA